MGLDNYAYKRVPIEDDKFNGIELCGGLMSGGSGSSSIRGKVYASLVEDITGSSMYDRLDENAVESISEQLCEFAKLFKSIVAEEHEHSDAFEKRITERDGVKIATWWYTTECSGEEYCLEDVINIAAWFLVVAENEGHVEAWF